MLKMLAMETVCSYVIPTVHHMNSETINILLNDIKAIFCDIYSPNSIKLLLGDFNVDLLKINKKSFIKEFLDNIFTLALCPTNENNANHLKTYLLNKI